MKENYMIVEKTKIEHVEVSTVFLGLDHAYYGKGPPLLFETMVFGGEADSFQDRYSTWDEAIKGHKEACEMVLSTFGINAEGLQKLITESIN